MIRAEGLAELARDLERAGPLVMAKVAAAVSDTAGDVAESARQSVPVDSGRLRGSITSEVTADRDGVHAEVGPEAFYGFLVEDGTSRKGPRPFMTPALAEHADSFAARVAKAADL